MNIKKVILTTLVLDAELMGIFATSFAYFLTFVTYLLTFLTNHTREMSTVSHPMRGLG